VLSALLTVGLIDATIKRVKIDGLRTFRSIIVTADAPVNIGASENKNFPKTEKRRC
jgi:hypothetical protein